MTFAHYSKNCSESGTLSKIPLKLSGHGILFRCEIGKVRYLFWAENRNLKTQIFGSVTFSVSLNAFFPNPGGVKILCLLIEILLRRKWQPTPVF